MSSFEKRKLLPIRLFVWVEESPILPLYERAVLYTTSDSVQGVVRRAVGFDPDFTQAKLQ
jgi:hypothetical protein